MIPADDKPQHSTRYPRVVLNLKTSSPTRNTNPFCRLCNKAPGTRSQEQLEADRSCGALRRKRYRPAGEGSRGRSSIGPGGGLRLELPEPVLTFRFRDFAPKVWGFGVYSARIIQDAWE